VTERCWLATGLPLREASDFGGGAVRLPGLANDFTASRTYSMKRSTTGLKVRFFSVRIATGHGRTVKSTGNIFNALKRTHEPGKAVMYSPPASNWPTT
jgi:hypothetical protein